MISALMSLIFGCTLIVRFGTMKGIHKAIRWAEVSLPSSHESQVI
jgi:hypothetical protein